MTMKLGRKPRRYDPRVPQMTQLVAGRELPPPPASVRWALGMPTDLGMMLNDTLGDCTCAAYYHALQLWSFNSNPDRLVVTEPDACVQSLYEAVAGYVPGNEATDQGADEQSVLSYLMNSGAPTQNPRTQTPSRHKLAAYVEIDVADVDNVKRAIADCGVVYIGFNVPRFLMVDGSPPIWDLTPDGDQTIEGGHAVILTGYDATAIDLVSWGQHYAMTWAFFAAFVDEAYALADVDWITAKGQSPAGLGLDQLEAAMAALRQ